MSRRAAKPPESRSSPGHDLFQSVVNQSVDGLMVIDRDGFVCFANPAAHDLFAGTTENLLGFHLGSPANREPVEMVLPRKDQTLHVEMRSCEILWESRPATLASLRDMTEHKRIEAALRERNAEIQGFYHTLSHELKTPLTSAREFLAIVVDRLAGPINETQAKYLGIAKESCDQLRLYINDLLDVTRLETGKMSIQVEPQPVDSLLEQAVAMLAPAAATKGIDLDFESQPDLPTVPVDRLRLLEVLNNLTANALKYTETGGAIHLSAREDPADPEYLQIAVRDNGIGIPEDQQDRIFDRLSQAHGDELSPELRSGLGLGLYICRELINLHGGQIWAESTPGEGSIFRFTLPKFRPPAGSKVMVVDDDAETVRLLSELLERAGHDVIAAHGGAQALELMREELPRLVILDLHMGMIDGPQVMRRIREQATWIQVIVHTAYPDSEAMDSIREFSPFTVLEKPASADVVLEKVRDALARIRQPQR